MAAALVGPLSSPPAPIPLSGCTYTDDWGTHTRTLEDDCTTDSTVLVPDGWTLDGRRHTITAVDPTGGHFVGAVVKNYGSEAHVRHLTVETSGLANVCDAGDNRLRGIMFDGASGSIIGNTVSDIHQGASGCQEGNAIEVRNAPFDGTHPGTMVVEVAQNVLRDYQKTGIVANGDVSVHIHHNDIGPSATQANLAANSIQVGFGGMGVVEHNQVDGNQWLGSSDYAATAILVYSAGPVTVRWNNIGGNSDVGIYVGYSHDVTVDNNRVFESGPDGDHGDWGVIDVDGTDNAFTNNKVRGFDEPFYGFDQGTNRAIPAPSKS